MERLQIVHPETNEPLGISLDRKEAIESRAWCRSTNVFVLDTSGVVLCHKRSIEKERMPGAWFTHLGGHVSEGETYESNALKEVAEESGIQASQVQLLPWRTTKIPTSRLWVREFVMLYDGDPHALVPQVGEVDEFRWMTIDEILEASAKDPHTWCAGTHDFRTEYACMRAVFHAAHALGALQLPQVLHAW